eukprot:TRINITY_DN2349_c2_g2_i1.p2 TRINITY_DN2349_c2_g2~~TRINITY_DN2349_c2_g2_i1.p2  ORF type:complete len:202 (+),score=74.01 TRINITY_DN2349_c2_g2_i1:231-836(+)
MVVPTVGQPAPDFALTALQADGTFKDIKLADYKGKWLFVFFYPLDFTFVCPTEIIAYSDAAADFAKADCEVLGVSVDSKFTHLAWTQTDRKAGGLGKLNIPLGADITKSMSRAYGALVEDGPDAGITFRASYIIDPTGKLRQVSINDLDVGRNVAESLRLVQATQFSDKSDGSACPINWTPGADTIKADPTGKLEYFEKHH